MREENAERGVLITQPAFRVFQLEPFLRKKTRIRQVSRRVQRESPIRIREILEDTILCLNCLTRKNPKALGDNQGLTNRKFLGVVDTPFIGFENPLPPLG
jgi:hypothetical protein